MNIVALKESVRSIALEWKNKLPDTYDIKSYEKLKDMFYHCFINTAETTAGFDQTAYVITGDIPAMWLRDSSAQVKHYIPFASKNKEIKEFIKSLIQRQFMYINIEAYTNAFNIEPNGKGYKDITESNPWVWERKYEIDSLCYPVSLLNNYYDQTSDKSIFDADIQKAFNRIVDLWITEQHHENSPYSFERLDCVESDTLPYKGKGNPVSYTGMTWSGFRPSDDACKYGYLVPSNIFAVEAIKHIIRFAEEIYQDNALGEKAKKLKTEIQDGINQFGLYEHELFGTIYAYETDGKGNYNLMDDANVPSLLSIPYLNSEYNNEIYQNTRKFILSKNNPYYYEGTAAKGIGSPHTPDRYIWHIALSMQGLTSSNSQEKYALLETLINTDAGTGLMHEGFHVDNPNKFTREWFAWSNSIFAEYVCHMIQEGLL